MKTKSTKKSQSPKAATSIEVFASHQKQLETVDPRDSPTRVDTLVAEGRLLAEVARRHRAKLVAIGVEPELLDSLDERATMVEGAQLAQRQAARGKDAEELAVTERANALRGEIRQPGGSLVLYAVAERARQLLECSDDEIATRYLDDLAEIFPGAREVVGEIVIQRWRHGTATGYPGRAANVTTLAQGFGRIRFAGDYMMPIDGVDASESGTAAARSILAALSVSP